MDVKKTVSNILEGKDLKEALSNENDFSKASDLLDEIEDISSDLLAAVKNFVGVTKGTRISEEARLYLEGTLKQFLEDYDGRQPGSIQSLKEGLEEYLEEE